MPVKKRKNKREQIFQQTLEKRRRLMWLGVIFSALIIILLWFFSWQFKRPVSSAKETPQENNLGNLLQEFKQTLTEAKSSLGNINEIINQAGLDKQSNEEKVIEDLKDEVLNKVEEDKATKVEEEGREVIIFK